MPYKKQVKFVKRVVTININSEADESVFSEIFMEREYKVLESIISVAKNAIVDVGAHVGMFSIYVRALNESVPVFAYEPDEKNFAALKENLRENRVRDVICKNLGVGDTEAQRILQLSSDSHNHSLIEGFFQPVGTKLVRCTTLERIFLKNNISICDLVKMDCEGAEFEILANLPRAIFQRVRNFYIEYHQYKEEMKGSRLKEILLRDGFKVEMKPSFYDKRMGFIWARR